MASLTSIGLPNQQKPLLRGRRLSTSAPITCDNVKTKAAELKDTIPADNGGFDPNCKPEITASLNDIINGGNGDIINQQNCQQQTEKNENNQLVAVATDCNAQTTTPAATTTGAPVPATGTPSPTPGTQTPSSAATTTGAPSPATGTPSPANTGSPTTLAPAPATTNAPGTPSPSPANTGAPIVKGNSLMCGDKTLYTATDDLGAWSDQIVDITNKGFLAIAQEAPKGPGPFSCTDLANHRGYKLPSDANIEKAHSLFRCVFNNEQTCTTSDEGRRLTETNNNLDPIMVRDDKHSGAQIAMEGTGILIGVCALLLAEKGQHKKAFIGLLATLSMSALNLLNEASYASKKAPSVAEFSEFASENPGVTAAFWLTTVAVFGGMVAAGGYFLRNFDEENGNLTVARNQDNALGEGVGVNQIELGGMNAGQGNGGPEAAEEVRL
ncbi:MAG: hypothetical protein ACON35_07285 [Candidatus Marinamargulisbacteria bacterium]